VSASQLRVVTGGFGQMTEFNAIAAAVLGGASLFGGRGSVFPGAFVGALLMQTIVSGLIFLNTDLYLQPVITYTIVFAVILLDSFRDRVQRRLSRRTILTPEPASA
jgi:ribose transport system permease protein